MITIFTTCKPFEGHIGVIQRNAIKSWTLLQPRPEIVIFGNDKGVNDICLEMDLKHIPDIVCNEYGTPLLNNLFNNAQQISKNDLLCYINADIILMSDFMKMIKRVQTLTRKKVIVARRWDADIKEELNFKDVNWEQTLEEYVRKNGKLQIGGYDYFIFFKGFYQNIPPFAIGKNYWDDWLGWNARKKGAILINATNITMAIHQNHKSTATNIKLSNNKEQEIKNNWKLTGRWFYFFHKSLPTHIIDSKNIYKSPWIDYFIHLYYRVLAYLVQSISKIKKIPKIQRLKKPDIYNENSVLKSFNECELAFQKVKELGLPPYSSTASTFEKNWDGLIALSCILNRTNQASFILDAGSVLDSMVLPWLSLYGYKNLFGINLEFKKLIKRGPIIYKHGDIKNTNFQSNSFDAIVCQSVIEHGIDINLYFKEMSRILKPGGIIITSTDYYPTLIDTKDKVAFGVPVHIFTRSEILNMFNIASNYNLHLTSKIEMECEQKPINWLGLNYTFIIFTLIKK